MTKILYKGGTTPFYCTQAQADTLDRLSALNKGGIGSVKGYVSTSNYVAGKPATLDLQIITRFETAKLYDRKRKALEAITFADVVEDIAKQPKLKVLPIADLLKHFNDRKASLMESLTKSLDVDRDDAHRQGHDRCYIKIADGVKVNLVTELGADKLKYPVLEKDGFPTAAAVLMSCLELSRKVVVAGEYKVVNSGAPVLMGNAIESKLNARSVGFMTLSLKEDNFTSLNVSKQQFTPADLKEAEPEVKSKLLALLEACGFSGDALKLIESLEAEGAVF